MITMKILLLKKRKLKKMKKNESEIINELYSDEIKEEKENKENQNENENEFDEDNIQPININEEIKKVS